jgi:hypothetical protein
MRINNEGNIHASFMTNMWCSSQSGTTLLHAVPGSILAENGKAQARNKTAS